DQREQSERDLESSHLRQNQEWLEDPQKNDEPRRFRPYRKKRGHRRGRALINVRHPDVKRDGGNFESKCDNDEDTTKKRGVLLKARSRKCGSDLLQVCFAGCSKDPR